MYDKIYDIETNQWVSIKDNIGKNIIKKYVQILNGGSGSNTDNSLIVTFLNEVAKELSKEGQTKRRWVGAQIYNFRNAHCNNIFQVIRRLFSKSFKNYPNNHPDELHHDPHARPMSKAYSVNSLNAMKIVNLRLFLKRFGQIYKPGYRDWAKNIFKNLMESGTISLLRLKFRLDSASVKNYINSQLEPNMTSMRVPFSRDTIRNMKSELSIIIGDRSLTGYVLAPPSLSEEVEVHESQVPHNVPQPVSHLGDGNLDNSCFLTAVTNAPNHSILGNNAIDEQDVKMKGRILARKTPRVVIKGTPLDTPAERMVEFESADAETFMLPLELQMDQSKYTSRLASILGPKQYNKGLYNLDYVNDLTNQLREQDGPQRIHNRRKWRTVIVKDIRTIWSNDKIREHQLLENIGIPMSNVILTGYPEEKTSEIWKAKPRDHGLKGRGQSGMEDSLLYIDAPARKFQDDELRAMHTAIGAAIESGKKLIMKSSHGANSDALEFYNSNSDGTIPTFESFKSTVNQFIAGTATSWEDWAVYQVRHGIIVEELFPKFEPFRKPIEIKVQTAWGKVVFATLESHPWDIIIDCNGRLHIIDRDRIFMQEQRELIPNKRSEWYKKYTDGTIETFSETHKELLERCLTENWDMIKTKSEEIAAFSGTEEMRCDWFLAPSGSEVEKKCILNEIAYIGGFGRLSKPMQHKYVKCIVDGFRRHEGVKTDHFDILYK